MQTDTSREYKTTNMALCAYLLMRDFDHSRCVKVSDRQAAMIFPWSPELADAVTEFRNGHSEVEPIMFQSKVAFVRQMLLNTVRGREHDC